MTYIPGRSSCLLLRAPFTGSEMLMSAGPYRWVVCNTVSLLTASTVLPKVRTLAWGEKRQFALSRTSLPGSKRGIAEDGTSVTATMACWTPPFSGETTRSSSVCSVPQTSGSVEFATRVGAGSSAPTRRTVPSMSPVASRAPDGGGVWPPQQDKMLTAISIRPLLERSLVDSLTGAIVPEVDPDLPRDYSLRMASVLFFPFAKRGLRYG